MRAPLDEYLRTRRVAIDNALERFLPVPPACPPVVSDAMRYSVFAGGKRFRPILTLASAETVAAHPAVAGPAGAVSLDVVLGAALPAACALEMIHTYSLIHDDLPAMDNDTMRRGRPTLHVVYGEGMAVLGGDALLTEAFGLLAREPAGGNADLLARKIRVIEKVATAAGVAGMVGGQALDLQATAGGARVRPPDAIARPEGAPQGDLAALERMHACKTGALIRAASVAGAIMGGGTPALEAAIDTYATALGLAFQIVDDILDIEATSEDLGKTAGKDAAAGKLTFPALMGVEASRRRAADCAERAHAALADAGLDIGYLGEIIDWVVCRTR